MPGFSDGGENYPLVKSRMSVDDANAIHAFIIDLQWKTYDQDQKRRAGTAR
jgi:hypothetical protein